MAVRNLAVSRFVELVNYVRPVESHIMFSCCKGEGFSEKQQAEAILHTRLLAHLTRLACNTRGATVDQSARTGSDLLSALLHFTSTRILGIRTGGALRFVVGETVEQRHLPVQRGHTIGKTKGVIAHRCVE